MIDMPNERLILSALRLRSLIHRIQSHEMNVRTDHLGSAGLALFKLSPDFPL